MKKTLATLALAGSIALVGAGAAQAGYAPLPPAATVSDATVAPGETFIFSGQGMLPNEPVTITVTRVDGSAPAAGSQSVASAINVFLAPQTFTTTADANGKFSLPISINEAGTYSILATGTISGNKAGPVTVVVGASLAGNGNVVGGGSASGNADGLAATGADASLLLWGAAGVGALGLGAAGVILARRNKNEAAV